MKTFIAIGYVWPEPNSSAAGSRMLQILSLMRASGYRVLFASPADDSDHAVNLAAMDIEKHRIELNSSTFDTWLTEQSPDIVMFDRFMMEEQFGWRVEKFAPKALRILDMEDVHCLRDARHRAIKAGRPVTELEWQTDMAFREIASLLRCDLTLVISEYEMSWLQDNFPVDRSKILYLPFMLSPSDRELKPFTEREHFISIGNFRHAPNWDAVLQLRELWPEIRRQLPSAELHVYGAYPPKKATQLDNPGLGFRVKGWAPSAEAVISNARVMLAPLRFGAGLKGKLLDAATLGTPAVTSGIGAEGMFGSEPSPAMVADEASEFVESAVALYRDEFLWSEYSARGPHLAIGRFNEAIHGQNLLTRIDDLLNGLERHRQCDFIGGMLRHHSLKSTQYMAQWIEAKNRH
ncbi:MAG: glycosyltransferase [Pseudomonadota bacterium]|uniref:glycosyltransferase n=1 Tax=Thalassolituus sp. UBA2590 TaxID=1947663 RepID=UPI002649B857|nr:glycosyltransferase [Thalassolituus sp. UBA2590]MEC9409953.1 glycosyltransferase [Pseudomonadota bacterium]